MSDNSVCIFYFPLNSTNLIFWTIHKIWWTCLLPIANVVTINILCISWRGPPFIWHPTQHLWLFLRSLRCCFFSRMKFAHTEITIIAAITLQWRRWQQQQQQQQSCQIGIDRILGFLVLAIFLAFFLAAWVFDLQLYWNFCGLVINSFSDGSSWKSSEIYIIFWALPGLPDELK